MPREKVRYTAYMLVDGSRKIVHLRCNDPSKTYKFIGVEACGTTCVINPRNDHSYNSIHLGVPRCDEKTIKAHLGLFNGHEDAEVEIELDSSLTVTVTGADEPHRPLMRSLGSSQWERVGTLGTHNKR